MLKVGNTMLYLPESWLRYNGIVQDSNGNAPTYPTAEYVAPDFVGGDNALHILVKNPEMMAQGLQFRIANSSLTTRDTRNRDLPGGVDSRSRVYELSFATRPLRTIADQAAVNFRRRVLSAPQVDGWVRDGDQYYDVASKYLRDGDYEFPVNAAPSAVDNMAAQFRYNDDLVVTYSWVQWDRPAADFNRWRQDRKSVIDLVRWLTTSPARRNNKATILVGGAR